MVAQEGAGGTVARRAVDFDDEARALRQVPFRRTSAVRRRAIGSCTSAFTRGLRGFGLAVALLFAAAACTGGRPAELPDASLPADTVPAQIRVMSFNIRYGTASDGDNAWSLRRDLAFRVVREFAPEVLGVQEALRFQLDEIAQELPGYVVIGVGRDDGIEQGEYSAILYDRQRFELLIHGTFWLSDTPEVPGSMSWGNRITRIATWARFRDRAADASTFYVFNTHWDHESQPSRERSAALILERIRARSHPDDPVLLMGDFNAGEDNPAFRALLADADSRGARLPNARAGTAAAPSLYDTFRAVHPNARETGTFNSFRGDRTGDRIDAILASPEWATVSASIVLFNEGGRYPSDHFPVTATLRLRSGPP
jgi:endonuclease/exonuclease/phosphatase family metal-dependent hydrolase